MLDPLSRGGVSAIMSQSIGIGKAHLITPSVSGSEC